MSATVHIVHCIDTEGPLYESVEATFERLKSIFHLDLEPSKQLLTQLQKGEVDLGGLEQAVQKVVDPHLLNYMDTWDKVNAMLEDALSMRFRHTVSDSFGGGWIYNWFCVDHIGYDINPRRRDIGYHNVYDHYRGVMRDMEGEHDSMHFHYHPHSFKSEAHRNATHWWTSSNTLFQILSRRIIDRQWFPVAHRPGFHVIRPDSHWFLEQFIPFDFSSQAMQIAPNDKAQFGLQSGRFGDWRRAPVTWEPYHPSHDDYQTPGACRRWVARCLNVGTRFRLLTENDMRLAFEEAQQGKPAVLGLTNHDFRDMRPDVLGVMEMAQRVAKDFPDVKFKYTDPVSAMREALQLPHQPACELSFNVIELDKGVRVLEVSSETPTFGPQPWLALKTVSGTYHHDNFDIDTPHYSWKYVFDDETFPIEAIEAIGVAGSNAYGITTVQVYDVKQDRLQTRVLNQKILNQPAS